MSIKSIELRNFTVFKNLNLDFSEGINIFIGENGTGKTQLIKAIYANLKISKSRNIEDVSRYFKYVNETNRFFVKQMNPMFLKVIVSDSENKNDKNYLMGKIGLNTNGLKSSVGSSDECSYEISYPTKEVKCVFIPAKDMLTHSKGFVSMADKFSEFPFDKTLVDIIKIAGEWQLKEIPKIALKILPILEKMMEGTVVIKNDEFYIKKHNGQMVDFSIEAEGLKKIGLIWQLLMNDNITENSVLLWDEPEANINPKFIPDLVDVLLELQRAGVQIFITTHNYILAKYFGVKKLESDEIRYYSLYKNENDEVSCESNANFEELKNNSIMDTFINLYKDEVVMKRL